MSSQGFINIAAELISDVMPFIDRIHYSVIENIIDLIQKYENVKDCSISIRPELIFPPRIELLPITRLPTLHPYSLFPIAAFNKSLAYNADFDGNDMNIFFRTETCNSRG